MYMTIRFAYDRANDLKRSNKQRTLSAYPDRERRPRHPKHWVNR